MIGQERNPPRETPQLARDAKRFRRGHEVTYPSTKYHVARPPGLKLDLIAIEGGAEGGRTLVSGREGRRRRLLGRHLIQRRQRGCGTPLKILTLFIKIPQHYDFATRPISGSLQTYNVGMISMLE